MSIYGARPRGAYRQMPKGNPRSLGFERYILHFPLALPRVDCGNDASLAVTDKVSVEAFIKPNSVGGIGGISGIGGIGGIDLGYFNNSHFRSLHLL